jgi:hypothetical protein
MAKRTTADMLQLDVRDLDDHGVITPGWGGHWRWWRGDDKIGEIFVVCEDKYRLRLHYTYGGDQQHDYTVPLEYTEPHFGGERPWFRCPVKDCGRRCAILYGGELFVCRECHDLAYPRENKSGSPAKVAKHRLYKLARKLDVDTSKYAPATLPWTPERPKGMHRDTYEDLLAEYHEAYQEHERAFYAGLAKRLEAAGHDMDLTEGQRALLTNLPEK